jgi:hypothetical protein
MVVLMNAAGLTQPMRRTRAQPSQHVGAWLQSGAVDVTPRAFRDPGASRLVIAPEVYEQLVAWPREAMLKHQICLDEDSRLTALVEEACGVMRHACPAEFTVSAVAIDASSLKPVRHPLVLQRLVSQTHAHYVIRP